MRAVVCHELRDVAGLRVEIVDDPRPGPDQVVVGVEAVGLSFLDVLIVNGDYQVPHAPPFIPGGEFAGRVLEVGSSVSQWAPGDLVAGETVVGALAERVLARADQLVRVPAGVGVALAATVLQSYTTALYALTRRAALRPDDAVLVLGAGGGVGLACVDVASSRGASVVAVASTPAKRALATDLGAVAVIDPRSEDVRARARTLRPDGFDVVVDPVGGALAEPSLRSLGYGGCYLVVGFASGSIPTIPLNLVLLNGRAVLGVELGAAIARDPGLAGELNREVMDALERGAIHPVEPTVASLSSAAEALRALRDGEVVGKVAVLVAN